MDVPSVQNGARAEPSSAPSLSWEGPGRLGDLDQVILKLMQLSGTPGLSIGVYQQGEEPYYANYGYRDVSARLPVDENTIFPASSLTKLFIAMAFAQAVDEGRLDWDSRVVDLLPEFDIGDHVLRDSITVADLLSHRSGMSASNFYRGSDNVVLISSDDGMDFINDQVPISRFREEFHYNDLGYEIAGRILDNIYGSWIRLLHGNLFGPLGMERSSVGSPPPDTENISKAYQSRDDASPLEISTVEAGEGVFGSASDGIFTCTADLIQAYTTFIDAIDQDDPRGAGKAPASNNPIQRVRDLFAPHIRMTQSPKDEAAYGLGLCRTHLPGPMGHLSLNSNLLRMQNVEMPTVAPDTRRKLVLYHQGNLAGASSAMAIIPEIKTAVVVMANSLGLSDCSDWVLQALLDDILGAKIWNDFQFYAQKSTESSLKWFHKLNCALDKTRKFNTEAIPYKYLVGTYWNRKHYLCIRITKASGKLYWALQGRDEEKFELQHFQDNIFSWLKPRSEFASRGRGIDRPLSFFKMEFSNEQRGLFQNLRWQHDDEVPEGEMFYREEGSEP